MIKASVLLHMLVPSHQDNCPLDEDANVRATGRGGRELQACRSRSCLTCTNQPAVCRVDPTNRVVTCKGDTSACRVEECDLCSRCVAYYGGNLTSFRFVSACISRDYPYTCGSTPAKCFRSDAVTGAKVGGANGLFDSGKLWCGCYGDNCTAELVFHYIVRNVSGVAVDTSAGPSVAPSTGHDSQQVPAEVGTVEVQLYEVVIAMLSCVLFVALVAALILLGLGTRKVFLKFRAERAENSFKFKKFIPLE